MAEKANPSNGRRSQSTTLKDIAAATGLSVSTVSRALARNPVIPETTREIVEKAARELKYRPNAQARALRSARTNIIGVIVPDIQNPYFSALAAAIQSEALSKDYSIVLAHSEEDPDRLNAALEMLGRQRVDGIIVVPHFQSTKKIADLIETGIPMVAADRSLPQPKIPSVTSDSWPGIHEALTEIKNLPDARLGYLAGPQDTSTGQQRLAHVMAAASDLAMPTPTVFYGGYQQEAGYTGTLELLESGVNCILAGDSMMTIGALQALHEKNLRIGEHVALIGFDDTDVFLLQNPPLSVIDQDVETMGRHSFDMLYTYIMSGDAPDSMVIPTTFKRRGSSSFSATAETKSTTKTKKSKG
ncbi:MAG: LacI family DNA-binding transcriptional regulator [Corynebacterium sp.]|uniref:LacI family DNA-binding transcriptional regulator n=1 Tax=Corynebacterium sp. TaxID=1720 RepID=UPI0026DCC58B|nr:LacI family DNA-binding transcriptional regulator [Corynebacterium sp.]MDO5097642.1 LacI family DNA-binding transcriptional regulator [Corynebacterium sp.]